MDFVRKNLGFVIFACVSVVLLVVLIVLDRKAVAALSASREKSDQQQRFIEQVSRGKYALNKKNLQQARRNHEIAKTELNDFLHKLDEDYTWQPKPEWQISSGVECVSIVRKTVRDLADLLKQRDIDTAQQEYFSFQELATSSLPPPPAQIPIILKQLYVADIIVKAAADSYVTEFNALERLDTPGMAPTMETGGYQAALYRVTVRGTGARLRTFLNTLNTQENVLFLIKRCDIEREKTKLARGTTASQTRSPRRRGPASDVPPPQYPYEQQGTGIPGEMGGDGTAAETPETPPRDERVVFDTMTLQATITLGLLEFQGPPPDHDEG